MRRARWTEHRLQRLFNKYNRLYFRGRVPNYKIKSAKVRSGLSTLKRSKRTITIDVEQIEARRAYRRGAFRARPESTTNAEIREQLFMQMAFAYGVYDKDFPRRNLTPKLRAWMKDREIMATQLEHQIVQTLGGQ